MTESPTDSNGLVLVSREADTLRAVPRANGSPVRPAADPSYVGEGDRGPPDARSRWVVGGSVEHGIWHTPEELSSIVEKSVVPEMVIGFDGFDPESKHK